MAVTTAEILKQKPEWWQHKVGSSTFAFEHAQWQPKVGSSAFVIRIEKKKHLYEPTVGEENFTR